MPSGLDAIGLEIERRLDAPVQVAWDCLTTPELIARWFFAIDFRPVVGHRFLVEGPAVDGWRGWTAVEVLELDPPRRMVWSFDCADHAPPSRVTFTLEPADQGTRLRLSHQGLAPTKTVRLLEDGWSLYVTRLLDVAAYQSGRGIAR